MGGVHSAPPRRAVLTAVFFSERVNAKAASYDVRSPQVAAAAHAAPAREPVHLPVAVDQPLVLPVPGAVPQQARPEDVAMWLLAQIVADAQPLDPSIPHVLLLQDRSSTLFHAVY